MVRVRVRTGFVLLGLDVGDCLAVELKRNGRLLHRVELVELHRHLDRDRDRGRGGIGVGVRGKG